jgi:16S rRNA (adenine1518-N6/adenine1519-N6)-dimethyltransferase
MTLREVRHTLERLGISPRKSLGQNFLVDRNILEIILREADLRPDETALEIGPGLGVLTRELLARARRVVAIETDPRLCEHLRATLPAVELIAGDAVRLLRQRQQTERPRVTIEPPFKVVANLPYHIASPLLQALVDTEPRPRAMVLLLQREVARRLAAGPRTKPYGALTLFTQLYYHVRITHVVSPGCFHPRPRVESAVVTLERRDPRTRLRPGAPFHEIVRAGFGQRRKMLRKLLAAHARAGEAFAAAGASPRARAEELDLEQWIRLANAL